MRTMHPALLAQMEKLALRAGYKPPRKIIEPIERRRRIRVVK
jgi:hypothetical protein